MAEEIRRRVAALRLAALLAVALTIAGLTTREPFQPVAGGSIPKDSVGSRQVIDHSLTAEDIRAGELLTPGQAGNRFLKIGAAQDTYLQKFDAADIYLGKIRAAEVYLQKIEADNFLMKDRAADIYLSKLDADQTYLKMDAQVDAFKLGGLTPDQFVLGGGSVVTGLVLMDTHEARPLMDLPGLGRLLAVGNGESVSARLGNFSGGPVLVMFGGTAQTVSDKGSTEIPIGIHQPTLVQLVSLESGLVSTVTLTTAMLGRSPLLSGQALVGR